jgi:hypothetical protein
VQDIQQMANKTGYVFATLVSFWLVMIGIGVSIVGFSGALASDEMENWIRGVMWVMAISGLFIAYGGFNMFIASRKKMRDIDKDEIELEQAVMKPVTIEEAVKTIREEAAKPFPEKNILLAHWTYTSEEWNTFTKKEFSFRIREALVVWLLIVGLGTWLLAGYGDMGHLAAFITSLSTGGLITVIRFIIAYNARKANSSKPGDVVISAKSILINGKYHILNDENKTLYKLELLKDETPQILEFSVEWNTRKGTTNEQVRIPIPADKSTEAAKLVEVFNTEVIGKY